MLLNEASVNKDPVEGYATTYHRIAFKIASLVAEKNKAYGDAFSKSSSFLKLLYPNGVKVEDYSNMLTIVRIFDKLMRIATNKGAFNEDPWADINGYTLLELNRNTK